MERKNAAHPECKKRDPYFCLRCPYERCTATYMCASKQEREFVKNAIGKNRIKEETT